MKPAHDINAPGPVLTNEDRDRMSLERVRRKIARSKHGRICDPEEEAVLRKLPIYVTPSKIDPWQGTYIGDAHYSLEQLGEMGARGMNADTAEFVAVRVSATRLVLAEGEKRPVRLMACPILQVKGERCLVLTPLATEESVYADGELKRTKPKARKTSAGSWRRAA